jgi:hypothetical protein
MMVKHTARVTRTALPAARLHCASAAYCVWVENTENRLVLKCMVNERCASPHLFAWRVQRHSNGCVYNIGASTSEHNLGHGDMHVRD